MQEIASLTFKWETPVDWKARDTVTTDRDESIDGLLRRTHPTDPALLDSCPDTETLAALADDTLAAAARSDLETHVAVCQRCQGVMALIAQTDVPVEATAGEDAAAVRVPWWRKEMKWLVPAAAVATAVAVWILIPNQQTPVPPAPLSDQQTPTPPAPLPDQNAPALPPLTKEVVTIEPLRFPGGAPAGATPAPPAATAPKEAPQPQAAPTLSELRAATRDQTLLTAEQNELARAERGAVIPEQQRFGQPSAPPAAAPPAAAAAVAPPTVARLAGAPPAAAARQASPPVFFDVIPPAAGARWQVGPGAMVHNSTDGGTWWTTQQTGVSAVFMSGSAPSAEVCWLVGQGGIVVRTIDGGRQWQRVPFPESADITAVTATTASDARVTLADGRRLTTSDGGQTWAPDSQ